MDLNKIGPTRLKIILRFFKNDALETPALMLDPKKEFLELPTRIRIQSLIILSKVAYSRSRPGHPWTFLSAQIHQ